MKKKLLLILICILIFLSVFVIFFGRVLPSKINIQDVESKVYTLEMNKDLFYRQTINNCGPYSVMCVANIIKNEILDPEVLAKETKWRIQKNLTFPQGVVDLLHKYDISTKEFILKNKTDEEKILWLKNNIQNGTPVILLIKVHHVLHYVTVIGYNEDGFMLYDSMQEKLDENPRKTIIDPLCITGNRFYTNDELLQLWDAGGYKIFFRNWAIVCN